MFIIILVLLDYFLFITANKGIYLEKRCPGPAENCLTPWQVRKKKEKNLICCIDFLPISDFFQINRTNYKILFLSSILKLLSLFPATLSFHRQ